MTGCGSKSEPNKALNEASASAAVQNFFQALGTGDTLLLQQNISRDFYMFEHEEKWEVNDLLALMPLTKGRVWSFKDIQFEGDKNQGHITYFNQGIVPSDRSWLESALLIIENDSVKIQFLHSTKLYVK